MMTLDGGDSPGVGVTMNVATQAKKLKLSNTMSLALQDQARGSEADDARQEHAGRQLRDTDGKLKLKPDETDSGTDTPRKQPAADGACGTQSGRRQMVANVLIPTGGEGTAPAGSDSNASSRKRNSEYGCAHTKQTRQKSQHRGDNVQLKCDAGRMWQTDGKKEEHSVRALANVPATKDAEKDLQNNSTRGAVGVNTLAATLRGNGALQRAAARQAALQPGRGEQSEGRITGDRIEIGPNVVEWTACENESPDAADLTQVTEGAIRATEEEQGDIGGLVGEHVEPPLEVFGRMNDASRARLAEAKGMLKAGNTLPAGPKWGNLRDDEPLKLMLDGLKNLKGVNSKKMQAVLAEHVTAIVRLRKPHVVQLLLWGQMKALMLLGWMAFLRVSEMVGMGYANKTIEGRVLRIKNDGPVGLDVCDVEWSSKWMVLLIRNAKNDQAREGFKTVVYANEEEPKSCAM